MTDSVRNFGALGDGRLIQAIGLTAGDLRAVILTYGATLQDLRLRGVPWPLTVGSDRLDAYLGPLRYAGAIAGPVANRLAGAEAMIDGQPFRFEANEGTTCLHGGATGTSQALWSIEAASPDTVTLGLDLPDGLGGFPGNRRLRATYRIEPPATLALDLTATTDAPTLMNLAQHSYWTLDGTGTIAGHRLRVAAARYLPVDDRGIPTGAAVPVDGTRFDFREGRPLEARPLYDHTLCLSDGRVALRDVAWLTGRSGLGMTLATTEPGLQVYDGRSLGGGPGAGLDGRPVEPYAGLALEAQGWPDAPHHPQFPSIVLRPPETYRQRLRLRFAAAGA